MKENDTTDFLDKGYPDDYYLDSGYIDTDEQPHLQENRRTHSRTPRRRRQVLNNAEIEHISENLEESIAVYEHSTADADTDTEHRTLTGSKSDSAGQFTVNADTGRRAAARRSRGNAASAPGINETNRSGRSADSAACNDDSAAAVKTEQRSENQGHTVKRNSANGLEEQNKKLKNNKEKVKSSKKTAGGSTESRNNIISDNGGSDSNGRKKKKKHPILRLLLILFLGTCAFVGYKFITGQSGYYTVAVFGVDSRNGNVGKDALSDVNIIARIDRGTGEVKLVSLYRDTYTKINADGTYHKLNEAYFRGGPEQAIWAVEHNTDVDIDDYATFNWKAVVDTINILGGVDLEITDKEFAYINAFITETVNSTGVGSYQLDHSGMNHLDGVQAVAYARLRLMDTDYQRTERQRKVIGLALEKAKAADYATLLNIVTTVMPEISTSVTPDDLIPFVRGIDRYYISETTGFPMDKTGQNVGKLDCVIPVTLESNAIKLHEFLYPDTPYTPSSGLKSISDEIINKTGLTGN